MRQTHSYSFTPLNKRFPTCIDVLLPVIELRRGTTYTFLVNGGTEKEAAIAAADGEGGDYHPFYLTTSISGGYAQLKPEERIKQTILAGIRLVVEQPSPSSPYVVGFQPTAVGPLCRFTETEESWKAAAGGMCIVCSSGRW